MGGKNIHVPEAHQSNLFKMLRVYGGDKRGEKKTQERRRREVDGSEKKGSSWPFKRGGAGRGLNVKGRGGGGKRETETILPKNNYM